MNLPKNKIDLSMDEGGWKESDTQTQFVFFFTLFYSLLFYFIFQHFPFCFSIQTIIWEVPAPIPESLTWRETFQDSIFAVTRIDKLKP